MSSFLSWGGPALMAIIFVIWQGYLGYQSTEAGYYAAFKRALRAAGLTVATVVGLLVAGPIIWTSTLLVLKTLGVDVPGFLTRMAHWPW